MSGFEPPSFSPDSIGGIQQTPDGVIIDTSGNYGDLFDGQTGFSGSTFGDTPFSPTAEPSFIQEAASRWDSFTQNVSDAWSNWWDGSYSFDSWMDNNLEQAFSIEPTESITVDPNFAAQNYRALQDYQAGRVPDFSRPLSQADLITSEWAYGGNYTTAVPQISMTPRLDALTNLNFGAFEAAAIGNGRVTVSSDSFAASYRALAAQEFGPGFDVTTRNELLNRQIAESLALNQMYAARTTLQAQLTAQQLQSLVGGGCAQCPQLAQAMDATERNIQALRASEAYSAELENYVTTLQQEVTNPGTVDIAQIPPPIGLDDTGGLGTQQWFELTSSPTPGSMYTMSIDPDYSANSVGVIAHLPASMLESGGPLDMALQTAVPQPGLPELDDALIGRLYDNERMGGPSMRSYANSYIALYEQQSGQPAPSLEAQIPNPNRAGDTITGPSSFANQIAENWALDRAYAIRNSYMAELQLQDLGPCDNCEALQRGITNADSVIQQIRSGNYSSELTGYMQRYAQAISSPAWTAWSDVNDSLMRTAFNDLRSGWNILGNGFESTVDGIARISVGGFEFLTAAVSNQFENLLIQGGQGSLDQGFDQLVRGGEEASRGYRSLSLFTDTIGMGLGEGLGQSIMRTGSMLTRIGGPDVPLPSSAAADFTFRPNFADDLSSAQVRSVTSYIDNVQTNFAGQVARGEISIDDAQTGAYQQLHRNIVESDVMRTSWGSQIASNLEQEMARLGIRPLVDTPTAPPVTPGTASGEFFPPIIRNPDVPVPPAVAPVTPTAPPGVVVGQAPSGVVATRPMFPHVSDALGELSPSLYTNGVVGVATRLAGAVITDTVDLTSSVMARLTGSAITPATTPTPVVTSVVVNTPAASAPDTVVPPAQPSLVPVQGVTPVNVPVQGPIRTLSPSGPALVNNQLANSFARANYQIQAALSSISSNAANAVRAAVVAMQILPTNVTPVRAADIVVQTPPPIRMTLTPSQLNALAKVDISDLSPFGVRVAQTPTLGPTPSPLSQFVQTTPADAAPASVISGAVSPFDTSVLRTAAIDSPSGSITPTPQAPAVTPTVTTGGGTPRPNVQITGSVPESGPRVVPETTPNGVTIYMEGTRGSWFSTIARVLPDTPANVTPLGSVTDPIAPPTLRQSVTDALNPQPTLISNRTALTAPEPGPLARAWNEFFGVRDAQAAPAPVGARGAERGTQLMDELAPAFAQHYNFESNPFAGITKAVYRIESGGVPNARNGSATCCQGSFQIYGPTWKTWFPRAQAMADTLYNGGNGPLPKALYDEFHANVALYTSAELRLEGLPRRGVDGARDPRFNHVLNTWAAMTYHAQWAGKVQARTTDMVERASWHEMLQISPAQVERALRNGTDVALSSVSARHFWGNNVRGARTVEGVVDVMSGNRFGQVFRQVFGGAEPPAPTAAERRTAQLAQVPARVKQVAAEVFTPIPSHQVLRNIAGGLDLPPSMMVAREAAWEFASHAMRLTGSTMMGPAYRFTAEAVPVVRGVSDFVVARTTETPIVAPVAQELPPSSTQWSLRFIAYDPPTVAAPAPSAPTKNLVETVRAVTAPAPVTAESVAYRTTLTRTQGNLDKLAQAEASLMREFNAIRDNFNRTGDTTALERQLTAATPRYQQYDTLRKAVAEDLRQLQKLPEVGDTRRGLQEQYRLLSSRGAELGRMLSRDGFSGAVSYMNIKGSISAHLDRISVVASTLKAARTEVVRLASVQLAPSRAVLASTPEPAPVAVVPDTPPPAPATVVDTPAPARPDTTPAAAETPAPVVTPDTVTPAPIVNELSGANTDVLVGGALGGTLVANGWRSIINAPANLWNRFFNRSAPTPTAPTTPAPTPARTATVRDVYGRAASAIAPAARTVSGALGGMVARGDKIVLNLFGRSSASTGQPWQAQPILRWSANGKRIEFIPPYGRCGPYAWRCIAGGVAGGLGLYAFAPAADVTDSPPVASPSPSDTGVSATSTGKAPAPTPDPRTPQPSREPSLRDRANDFFGFGTRGNGTGGLSGLGQLLQGLALYNALNQQPQLAPQPPLALQPALPPQPGTTPPPSVRPSAALVANPNAIAVSATAKLTWTSFRTTSCEISGGGQTFSGGTSGSTTTLPLATTTAFTLTCTGDFGPRSVTTTVYVGEQPPTSPQVTTQAAPTIQPTSYAPVTTGSPATSNNSNYCDPGMPTSAFIICLQALPGSANPIQ